MRFHLRRWFMEKRPRYPNEVTDLKRCVASISETSHCLDKLEIRLKGVAKTALTMITSFDKVGESFYKTVDTTVTHSKDTTFLSFGQKQTVYSEGIYDAARVFALAVREMEQGENISVFKKIIEEQFTNKVHLLREELRALADFGNKTLKLLKNYHDKKTVVEMKEIRYSKSQKSLDESKYYPQQLEESKRAHELAITTITEFKEMYSALMAKVDEFEVHFVDGFIQDTCGFLQQVHGRLAGVISTISREYPRATSTILQKPLTENLTPLPNDYYTPETMCNKNDIEEGGELRRDSTGVVNSCRTESLCVVKGPPPAAVQYPQKNVYQGESEDNVDREKQTVAI